MEGAEALLDEENAEHTEREDLLADADEAFEREPELVGAGKHAAPEQNGHAQLQTAAAPITASSGLGRPVETAGLPVTGHVRRQDGSAVPGAALTLIDQRGRQVARGTGQADGAYSVGAPGSGTYVLIVSANGYQPQASSVVVGDAPTRLDLTLTGSGEVTGVVRAAGSGVPLANVTVTMADSRGEVTGACITGADGAYAFSGVGSGTYTLVASGQRLRPSATTLNVPDSGELRHDVELAGAASLTGTARTDGDRVVPDARITVLDADGNVAAVATTDESGRYVLSDLPEGDYTVVASGYPPATSTVSLSGGESEHDVRLGYDQAIDELTGREY